MTKLFLKNLDEKKTFSQRFFGQLFFVFAMLFIGVFTINTSAKAADTIIVYDANINTKLFCCLGNRSEIGYYYYQRIEPDLTNTSKINFVEVPTIIDTQDVWIEIFDYTTSSKIYDGSQDKKTATSDRTRFDFNEISLTLDHIYEIRLHPLTTNIGFTYNEPNGSVMFGSEGIVYSSAEAALAITIGYDTPPTIDYIIAYPEEPDYTPIGGNFNISYVFDVCEYQNLNPTSTLSISLEPMGEGRNKEIITNCSGAKKFTTKNLETVEGSYPNAHFRIYDETLYQEIAISNEFWEVIYKQIEGSELFLRPLKFNATYEGATSPQDTSTITIPFMYSFCNNLVFSETNKICIISRNNNNTKPSNICFTTETCGGIGSVEIPKFSGGTTNNWRFDYFDNSGKRLFEGREFSITFEAVNEPLSDSNVYGMDAHDIACSAEEWATPNPVWEILGNSVEIPAFNFTRLKCTTFESAIKTGNFLVNGFIGIIKNLAYGQMSNAFPLNVPFLTLEAWNKATIEQAPNEIEEIISTNENDSIVLPIPTEWTNNEELEIIVWGSEIFEKDAKIKKIFDLTRIITAWAFYIGLIGYLIKLGVMLWEEFIRKKKSGLDLQSVSVYDKENNATFHFKAWDEED